MGACTRLSYHVMFGTRYHKPVIHDDFREHLYDYLGGVLRGTDFGRRKRDPRRKGELIEMTERFGGVCWHDIKFEHRYLFEGEHHG